jgi:hypothetical protein
MRFIKLNPMPLKLVAGLTIGGLIHQGVSLLYLLSVGPHLLVALWLELREIFFSSLLLSSSKPDQCCLCSVTHLQLIQQHMNVTSNRAFADLQQFSNGTIVVSSCKAG